MPTYVDNFDFLAYVPGFVVQDSEALDLLLDEAEEDIDNAIHRGNTVDSIRRFDLDLLTELEATYLKRAVCAQAEYRLHMGETFFVEGRQKEVTGRDAHIRGPLPHIGPKARIELTRGKLWNLWARTKRQTLPNQNVGDIIP